MTVVGLIGKIGAGKTTVANLLQQHGAVVIDADALTHDALKDQRVQEQVRTRFGASVFTGNEIDRSRLAECVFGNQPEQKNALKDLEGIIHPRVRKVLEERLRLITQREGDHGVGQTVVVLDVPLLVQGGLHNRCDRLIWLECEDSVRHRRLAVRGLSAEQVAAREEAWSQGFPSDVSSFQAVSTVDTSVDIAYTEKQIEELWVEFTHGSS
ncbi:MAG: dephospho-CoA kinase [Pirellulales bacterium]|jgi:dephospho-CoA kinase